MRARPFSSDSESLLTRVAYLDDVDQKLIIDTQQDVTDIVEDSKAQFKEHDDRSRFGGDGMVRVAQIPMVLFMALKEKGITDDPKAFAAWLNDPDNRHFRTRPGRV